MFEYDDGSRFYYESISRKNTFLGPDGVTYHKSGVRGPIEAERLDKWHFEKPDRRSMFLQRVEGLTDEEIVASEEFLKQAVPRITYAKRQIFQNARYLITGGLGRVKSISPTRWTCSETGFRCLPVRMQHFLGLGEFIYDWIVPSGVKAFGLLEMVDRWNYAQRKL